MPDSLTDEATVPNARARARRAAAGAYGDDAHSGLADLYRGESYPLSDLIADLLHLGEQLDHDADELIDSARRHYEAERAS